MGAVIYGVDGRPIALVRQRLPLATVSQARAAALLLGMIVRMDTACGCISGAGFQVYIIFTVRCYIHSMTYAYVGMFLTHHGLSPMYSGGQSVGHCQGGRLQQLQDDC